MTTPPRDPMTPLDLVLLWTCLLGAVAAWVIFIMWLVQR